jgi:hypothetical protein
MVLEILLLQMVIAMKELGKRTKNQEMELSFQKMDQNMLENLKMT